ncbi:MAG: adenine deaminase [Spirochaetaceae bacterium]|jgi:adenine deaminase|nr:adenine deaminase [Spirochaetaceae bacterium]
MEKHELKKLIDTAAGRIPADMVIRNGTIVDVYSGGLITGDVAICDRFIAGIGSYEGRTVLDAAGQFVLPGFIDSHIHIESAYVSPEELGRLLVPHGTTAIIADPHEIVNACGIPGLTYMLDAAEETALNIKFMLPSCVPATSFEHSGAVVDAKAMEEPIRDSRILGLGEFMDFPGVIRGADDVLDKILLAKARDKLIDGHSPRVTGNDLNAYAAALIHTDHECATPEDLAERLSRGMYVMLRQGSACRDLRNLLKGVTARNSRRCILCSDDRQPKTILELGHLDDHLRICVEEGLDPITAVQMATINAAECFRLYDQGGIAPGLRADIAVVDNLKDFRVNRVLIGGVLVAEEGQYLLPFHRHDDSAVRFSFHVKDFSIEKFRLPLKEDRVYVIDLKPGSVVTGKGTALVKRDANGNFVYDPRANIAKVAVLERYRNTGNAAVALLRGYGIRRGAIALSVAHDSHNIIVVGVTDDDMTFAVEKLLAQGGGIMLVKDHAVLESMPLPLGGIMSDQSGEWVDQKLLTIHETAYRELGVSREMEPVMTLCFMSLPVIPELKLTDMGLFDVEQFRFIPLEAGASDAG